MSVKINDDQQSATLIVDWNKFPEMAAENLSNGVKDYQIKGFDKKIEKIYFGGFGHDCSGETLFYLMEDSSVEYTPLYVQKHDTQSPRILSYVNLKNVTDASGNVIEEYVESNGVVPGVSNVVDFYTVTATAEHYGWYTTIAATADGSFYDLDVVMKK